MKFSIIVNFHNMRREAERVIYSLTPEYQKNSCNFDYEVVAVDNNSTDLISLTGAASRIEKLTYIEHQSNSKSPAAAINEAVAVSIGDAVVIIIDGARILSPGIFSLFQKSFKMTRSPFAYTAGFHLGPTIQNRYEETGYCREVEDELLGSSGWTEDGYNLFNIATAAASVQGGMLGAINESNCFCLRRCDWDRLGGYDERFQSPGGGLVNLDFFNRAVEDEVLEPIMLLGEGTFHQFHGGTAANARMNEHPWAIFDNEYREIRRGNFRSRPFTPIYFGSISQQSRRMLV